MQELRADAIERGSSVRANDLVAARQQHQERKRLASMNHPLATENEVLESKRRKRLIEAEHLENPVLLRLDRMERRMERRMEQMEQRNMNRFRRTTSEAIVPVIRLSDGKAPDAHADLWFPADQNELMVASSQQCDALLEFYDLSTRGNIEVQRTRLKQFLGVIL